MYMYVYLYMYIDIGQSEKHQGPQGMERPKFLYLIIQETLGAYSVFSIMFIYIYVYIYICSVRVCVQCAETLNPEPEPELRDPRSGISCHIYQSYMPIQFILSTWH